MTDKYAVIGNPISHSKSPQIHKLFAEQTSQDISYDPILSPLHGFTSTIKRLVSDGYKGCSITLPFKFEAFQISQHLSESAQASQAVNTLKFDENTIYGANTDGSGLVRDIQHNLGFTLKERRVLLMGAGGAAYGVIPTLLSAGTNLSIVNRTFNSAQRLAEHFETLGNISILKYEELGSQAFECIINATSSSITNEMPPLPNGIFSPDALAYDMMYGRDTPFMRFAREQGADLVSDGLGMLVEQAAEAFFIWRKVRPETTPVILEIRKQT